MGEETDYNLREKKEAASALQRHRIRRPGSSTSWNSCTVSQLSKDPRIRKAHSELACDVTRYARSEYYYVAYVSFGPDGFAFASAVRAPHVADAPSTLPTFATEPPRSVSVARAVICAKRTSQISKF